MTRRHPDDALISNPNDTARPRRSPRHQSPRHGATKTTPWSANPKTRRHPEHALLTNPNDTAPPTPCPGQQSPRHGATERTGRPAIPMAKRHPREDAQQQSPWHSAAHATRPAAIPMAQRHPRDSPNSNPHGTAPHARHARRPSSQPATAFHGTAPHTRHARRSLPLRSKKRPLQAHIRKSTDSLRLPRFRNAQRAPAHAFCRTGPRKPAILADRARFIAPATRIHRPVPSRAHQCIRTPTPATRNAGRSA